MNRGMRGGLAVMLMLAIYGIAQAQDIVYYYDRATKKEQQYRGTIESESPGGVKIKVRDGKDMVVKQVPPSIITWVFYDTPDVDKLTYRSPFSKEERGRTEDREKQRAKYYLEAMEGYTKLEQSLRSKPNARRYFQFKIAELTAQQAQDDPSRVDQAIKLLSDYKTAHSGSWEIMPALKLLARLLESTGKIDEARQAYEDLGNLPDVPSELKRESSILVGRLFLRSGKYAEAEKRLQSLASSLSRDDSQYLAVKAYLVASEIGQNKMDTAQKELGDVLANTGDLRIRGLAHNLLGDFFRKKGQMEEAFWHYLRVDAVYNEDAEQQAKALYYLIGLFDKVKKDPLRGKECAARLQEQRFNGTEYQRLQQDESKKKTP